MIFLVSFLNMVVILSVWLGSLPVQISDVIGDRLPVFWQHLAKLPDGDGVAEGAVLFAVDGVSGCFVGGVGFKQSLSIFPFVEICDWMQRQITLELLLKDPVVGFPLFQYVGAGSNGPVGSYG